MIESRPILRARGIRFDWAMAVLSTILTLALYIDLWAHAHGRTDNSFFTPYHALMYAMIATIGLFLSITAWRELRRGRAWRESLPPGYGLSLIGIALFGVAGVTDLLWHQLFGVEFSVQALLSPTHLGLASSGVLIVTGSLRSAWHDPQRRARPWRTQIPAVLSLAALLSFFTGMTQFIHPINDPRAEVISLPLTAQNEIYLMKVDGTAQTRLMISRGDSDGSPAFSGDGATIFFTRSTIGERKDPIGNVYRMSPDGSNITQLTGSPRWYSNPLPSPDGKTLAVGFVRQDTRKWTIATMPVTGGGDLRLLTEGRTNDVVDGWSPDGRQLVFHSDREGGKYQVYTIGVDSSATTRLTSGATNLGGSWSADGRTIAFASKRDGRLQIYVMSPDGSNQRRLINSKDADSDPSWSPDGKEIAFISNRGGLSQLYVANADGNGQRNLLQNYGVELAGSPPSWSADGQHLVYAASPNLPAYATDSVRNGLGVAAIILQTAILMGVLLLGLRGGTLPVGSLTLIVGMNAVLVSVLQDRYWLVPGAILGGVLADILLWRLQPGIHKTASIRLFSVTVPVIVYACYFLTVELTVGIGWSIHLWLGSIVMAGIIGLLLSYLMIPPPGATRDAEWHLTHG